MLAYIFVSIIMPMSLFERLTALFGHFIQPSYARNKRQVAGKFRRRPARRRSVLRSSQTKKRKRLVVSASRITRKKRPSLSQGQGRSSTRKAGAKAKVLVRPVNPKLPVSPRKKITATPTKVARTTANPFGVYVGDISHFFPKIMVCVLEVKGQRLALGDKMLVVRKDAVIFSQDVQSLQVESIDVAVAKKGQLVGLKVKQAVKEGDQVYK